MKKEKVASYYIICSSFPLKLGEMNAHQRFELNPSNSRKSVLDFVLARYKPNPAYSETNGVPELLSEFITLLANEKEDWEGLQAMKVCSEEFFNWKKKEPKEKNFSTVDELEKFLFTPDRNVIVIQAVVPRADDPSQKSKTLKEPGCSSSSKAVIPGAVLQPANLKAVKEPDNQGTSKAVGKGVVGETSVGPENPETLKVKIYMGTGWDGITFPNLSKRSPPNFFVNLGIRGGESQKTKVQEKTKTPCWGEEFVFRLPSSEGAELVVEVNDIKKKKIAGKFFRLVSALKPGIQVIPLSSEVAQEGNPCSSARLLVRIMLD